MKKNFYLLPSCLILIFSLFPSHFLLPTFLTAQTPEWVYQHESPYPNAIAVDSAGNTYTTGCIARNDTNGLGIIALTTAGSLRWFYFNDTLADWSYGEDIAIKFNKIYVAGYAQFLGGNKDLIVLCVDTLGHTEWIHRDTGALEANAVTIASSRMVYIAGFTYTSNSLLDIIVKKLDSLGNEVWRYIYDGPAGSYDEATSIVVDCNENIYVGGYSTGFGTAEDFTVLKLDSAGHLVWECRYDGPAHYRDEPKAMALDTLGNIYIAGGSWGVDWDFCVVKIDSSGQEEWVYRYNGLANGPDNICGLVVDDSGNVYIGGVSVDDTVELFTVIKVDLAGQEKWRYTSAGPFNKGGSGGLVALDRMGGVYVAGTFLNLSYRAQIAVVKLNPGGGILWTYIYPHQPPSYYHDGPDDIVADVSGNIFVAGRINVSTWNDDIVVMKFASSQGKIKEVMKNEIRDKSKNATIFKGGIEFLPEEDCGLKVYDVSGRVVVDRILQSGKRESIRLLSGVYFIVIEGENGKRVKKVIVL